MQLILQLTKVAGLCLIGGLYSGPTRLVQAASEIWTFYLTIQDWLSKKTFIANNEENLYTHLVNEGLDLIYFK